MDKLELFLAGVTGNMHLVHALIHDLAAALQELVTSDKCFIPSRNVPSPPPTITRIDNTSLISAYSIQNEDYGLITER